MEAKLEIEPCPGTEGGLAVAHSPAMGVFHPRLRRASIVVRGHPQCQGLYHPICKTLLFFMF